MASLVIPRVPTAPLTASVYESHYLTATDPGGGRALWLRYTALKRPRERVQLSVWLTRCDQADPRPTALRVTSPDSLSDPGERWSRSSLGEMSPAGARGAIGAASWCLSWTRHAVRSLDVRRRVATEHGAPAG
ncbi:MAG: hypothetical protein ACXVUE_09215 [Solirubrobacteraceae bacterium]